MRPLILRRNAPDFKVTQNTYTSWSGPSRLTQLPREYLTQWYWSSQIGGTSFPGHKLVRGVIGVNPWHVRGWSFWLILWTMHKYSLIYHLQLPVHTLQQLHSYMGGKHMDINPRASIWSGGIIICKEQLWGILWCGERFEANSWASAVHNPKALNDKGSL